MDLLQQCAAVFERLAGLHKLKDISIARDNRQMS